MLLYLKYAWRQSIRRDLTCALVCLTIFTLLVACTSSASKSSPDAIKIGYSASLTGMYANDGKALQQGFLLWQDSINARGGLLGRSVQLIGLDDGSVATRVSANYKTLVSKDHVDLLLGPYSSLLMLPAVAIANQHHYALFSPTGNAQSVYAKHLNTTFVITPPAQQSLQAFSYFILSLPQALRPKTAAYVSVAGPFAAPSVATAQSILSPYVRTVYTLPKPYSVNANVSAIAQQIVRSQADVVVLGTSGLTDSVAFIEAFRAQHYNPKAIIATSGPNEGAQFLRKVGVGTAEGVFIPNTGWYPGFTTYQNDQFTQAYLKQYGGSASDISATTAEAFAACQLLEQAVDAAHSTDNARLVQLLHTTTFNSLQGPLRFDADGRNTIGISNLFQWIHGQLVPVYPFTNAQANPEYPKQNWS